MKRFVLYWALAGLAVPFVILVAHWLRIGPYVIPDYLKIMLWPSSVVTMALQEANPVFAAAVLIVSIALNVGVYSALGALFWWLGRLVTR